jgi:hypothetical protein
MGPIFRFLLSIPVLPIGNRRGRGLLYNRRAPSSRWISPNDLYVNTSDWLFGFTNRIPHESWITRDRNNSFRGSTFRTDQRVETDAPHNPFGDGRL